MKTFLLVLSFSIDTKLSAYDIVLDGQSTGASNIF